MGKQFPDVSSKFGAPMGRRHHCDGDAEKPLTHADLKALAWAVRRAGQNSGISMQASQMSGVTNADCIAFSKDYEAKVKSARRALRKVRELKGQGL